MKNFFTVNNKRVHLPIFCPDATRGVVRSLSLDDLTALGVAGVIVNTWHLGQYPGAVLMQRLGGIKKLMNYQQLVISDSGGFQVYSLFEQQANFGKITDAGLVTYTDSKKQHKMLFTPEDSIAMQFALGSDIMICLDDFTPPGCHVGHAQTSVQRTIAWAKRCKCEFERQLHLRGDKLEDKAHRPQLFAVIQGDRHLKLRQFCAESLQEIGFDGYGLGGLPFTPEGKLDVELCEFNARLTSDNLPRYAMGLGKVADIIALHQLGYQIFDCVLPTRDARHGRLYIFNQQNLTNNYLQIKKTLYQTDTRPLDEHCSCATCRQHSRAYLHHLYKIGESAYARLATIHNLHQYLQLMKLLGKQA